MLPDNKEDKKKSYNKLAKYGGLAFQLLAYIGVGYFVGAYIDKRFQNSQPYGAAFGSVILLIVGIYAVVRDILREN